MAREAERGVDWVHLPVIATVARLLCRELTLQNEYLLLENRTLKSKIPGRLRFTDEERRYPNLRRAKANSSPCPWWAVSIIAISASRSSSSAQAPSPPTNLALVWPARLTEPRWAS